MRHQNLLVRTLLQLLTMTKLFSCALSQGKQPAPGILKSNPLLVVAAARLTEGSSGAPIQRSLLSNAVAESIVFCSPGGDILKVGFA